MSVMLKACKLASWQVAKVGSAWVDSLSFRSFISSRSMRWSVHCAFHLRA